MTQDSTGLEYNLLRILQEFQREVDGIRGSAIADRQGLPLANGFHEDVDLMSMSAMSAMAMESSHKIFEHVGVKGFQNAILEGEDARVVVFALGRAEASLIAVAYPSANLGVLKFRMALAARRLEEELGLLPRTGARIDETFLLTRAGLLIEHVSLSEVLSKDRDIMAGMVAVIQAFVRDSFGDRGGVLEEMGMGNAILRPLPGVPQVSVWVVYRVGSRNEVPGMTGSTHWVEHMLFKGGGKLGKGDLDRLISRVGGKYNGFTDKDWTMYYETIPAEHLETALFVESERMRNAAFDPKEFDAERTVVISEREGSENQPEFLVEEEMWGTAFHVHPYHWLPIGYKQDLARMARDEVYAWYRRWYAPNNAVLVLVGGFDADRAVAMVHTYFDPLRPEPAPPAPRFEEPAQMG